jgi:hypothetical protein
LLLAMTDARFAEVHAIALLKAALPLANSGWFCNDKLYGNLIVKGCG